jgi:hypothetical protein
MRLLFAFLADFALAHPDGKAYVVGGGVDTLYAAQLPAKHSHISLIVKIEFTPRECGRQHTVEVHGLDADGEPFIEPTAMQLTPERNAAGPTLPTGFQFVLNVQNLELPSEGEYAFSVVVDGTEFASVPLRVVRADPLQQLLGVPPQKPNPG